MASTHTTTVPSWTCEFVKSWEHYQDSELSAPEGLTETHHISLLRAVYAEAEASPHQQPTNHLPA